MCDDQPMTVVRVGGARAEFVRPVPRIEGRALRVGVSGGIGSGKSTFARALADLPGVVVADADEVAREVVAPGSIGLEAVVVRFGPAVLLSSGELDRAALGALVFEDPQARADLENILHPLIAARADEILSSAPVDGLALYDVPLLVEAGMADQFDAVIMVDAPVEDRLARLEDRGMSPSDARLRIDVQADESARRRVAHVWVSNEGTDEDLAGIARQMPQLLRQEH